MIGGTPDRNEPILRSTPALVSSGTSGPLALNRSPPYFSHDSKRRLLGIIMLPDAYNDPSHLLKRPVRGPVPFNVPLQLCSPPLVVRLGPCPMLRAGMPKATVHEHRNLGSNEDNVCSMAQPGYDLSIDTETEIHSM